MNRITIRKMNRITIRLSALLLTAFVSFSNFSPAQARSIESGLSLETISIGAVNFDKEVVKADKNSRPKNPLPPSEKPGKWPDKIDPTTPGDYLIYPNPDGTYDVYYVDPRTGKIYGPKKYRKNRDGTLSPVPVIASTQLN